MEKARIERRLFKLVRIVALNLLLLGVLLELVSLGFYFSQTRHFFYPRNNDLDKAASAQFAISEPGREPWMSDYQLHPYFGFMNPPNYDGLPLKKTRDQFIIGIFGGSVAQQFCDYEFQHHVLAQMVQALPEFQNKQIVLIKFASQAHKQPQQLLILNYFLSVGQELDMAINVDGFNEIALAYLNNKAGTEVSMPNDYVYAPLAALANRNFSSEQLQLSLEVLQLKYRLQNTANRLAECRMATCYMLRWAQARYFLHG